MDRRVIVMPLVWAYLCGFPGGLGGDVGSGAGSLSAAELSQQEVAIKTEIVARGIRFLRQSQAEDGSYSAHAGPAVTALVASALMQSGISPTDPLVQRSLDYLQEFAQQDGGIYAEGSTHTNYETCLAVRAFQQAGQPRYQGLLTRAEAYLKKLQWDEGEGHDIDSTNYGGAGYGSHQRPDLSNTQFLIETLQQLGRGADDPAIQKALIFVSRTQNLESSNNTTPFAAKINDGGFYYTPAAGGSSKAGETPEGGLRSYGSMTYAGLKSMIYAGVDRDDPRVVAAADWIRKHYTLTENPGVGQQGLFYYYHTFAKTLATLGWNELEDAAGNEHPWRKDLLKQLSSMQLEDGSWINPTQRWMEADPNLVTAYALLALSYE